MIFIIEEHSRFSNRHSYMSASSPTQVRHHVIVLVVAEDPRTGPLQPVEGLGGGTHVVDESVDNFYFMATVSPSC